MIDLKNPIRYIDFLLKRIFFKGAKQKCLPSETIVIKKPITVVSLFGGIASELKSLKMMNMPFHLVDIVENNKDAIAVVNALYKTNFNPSDIRKLDNKTISTKNTLFEIKPAVKKHNTFGRDLDLMVAGFPCEDISSQGNQEGMECDSGTRSSLVYYSKYYIEAYRPKYMVFECPYGSGTKFFIKGQQLSLKPWLESFGYRVTLEHHQSVDFGYSHSRERLYFVCIRNDLDTVYVPIQSPNIKRKPISYYLDSDISEYEKSVVLTKSETAKLLNGDSFMGRVVSLDETIYPAILHHYNKSSGSSGKIPYKNAYRILTPKELLKMFDYSYDEYMVIKSTLHAKSNKKLCGKIYKLIGNSIIPGMLCPIFKQLFTEYLGDNYIVEKFTLNCWDTNHQHVRILNESSRYSTVMSCNRLF